MEEVVDQQKEEFKKCSEIYLWSAIEQLGGFVWRMEHDLADGRIQSTPGIEADIMKMREYSAFAVSQLYRFGIQDPKESKEAQDRYWKWYHAWKDYFQKVSDEDLRKIEDMLRKDPCDPCEGYGPAKV